MTETPSGDPHDRLQAALALLTAYRTGDNLLFDDLRTEASQDDPVGTISGLVVLANMALNTAGEALRQPSAKELDADELLQLLGNLVAKTRPSESPDS